ncbi:MAG: YihY/virulence factor BrkB family protein [Cypionkella sp.]|jgi:membrane protein|nr:YihY/virulence factor BrkB family protein [Cypionkella sp.]
MSISFSAFWPFLLAVHARMARGHFGLIAAGVAFYAMFAVFPGLAASVAVWSLVADPAVIAPWLEGAEGFLPEDAAALLRDQLLALLSTPRATLGWATALSIGVALFSARAGVSALVGALEAVHRTRPRPFLWRWMVDIMLTCALILALCAALATSILLPLLLEFLPLGGVQAWLLSILPRLGLFLMVLAFLAILYRFGPNRASGTRPKIALGVVVAAVGWAAVSYGFSAYLANFGTYNRIYGSIGAVAALLMWLYLSVWSILLGAAVNAERGRISA